MIDDGDEGKKRCALKYLVSGGEKISDEVLKIWAGREDVILANFYGCVSFFPPLYIWRIIYPSIHRLILDSFFFVVRVAR